VAEPRSWIIERLSKKHSRTHFSCGDADLDSYLKKYAGQNERLNISRHYVAVASSTSSILGYYTLSAGGVAWTTLPDDFRRKLPKYPVPVAHLGRLAVDETLQGQGMGEFLLVDALARVIRVANEIAIHAVEVIAATEQAKRFYEKYGFLSLIDDPRHMYLALATARKLGIA
jgi:ribosomal protein S18 acetylase RimI-like enzyme